jgi:hypothetical protein
MKGTTQPSPAPIPDHASWRTRGDDAVLRAATAAVADPVTGRPSETRLLSQVGVSTGATTGGDALNKDAIAGRLTLDAAKLADQLTAHLGDTKARSSPMSAAATTPRAWPSGWAACSTAGSRATASSTAGSTPSRPRSCADEALGRHGHPPRRTREDTPRPVHHHGAALSRSQSQGSYLSSQLARLSQA